jgi:hypothetical protein
LNKGLSCLYGVIYMMQGYDILFNWSTLFEIFFHTPFLVGWEPRA